MNTCIFNESFFLGKYWLECGLLRLSRKPAIWQIDKIGEPLLTFLTIDVKNFDLLIAIRIFLLESVNLFSKVILSWTAF